MDRLVKKSNSGEISINGTIVYSPNDIFTGQNENELLGCQWEIIEPKYYKYKDDNCLIEVWYDGLGMVLDSGLLKNEDLVGFISNTFTTERRIEITYEKAMQILSEKGKNYSNKDLMSRIKDELEQENNESQTRKQNNNGGASDWYSLPKNANTLQDLIEHRNMNGSIKDIFKACYRLGIKTEDELRDANKMAYYSLREVGRISGRKDYITIAKELMGSQAIEKE